MSIVKTAILLRERQEGNVLFLILIAVALFAALSYAVTSSTRSKGDTGKEGTLIASAAITQYPSSVIIDLRRMIFAGTSPDELRFNTPADFDKLSSPSIGVFHPSGGGATYVPASADTMKNDQPGEWFFNAEMEVPEISTTGEGNNDLIAYLVGLKKSICSKINEEYGLGDKIPVLNGDRAPLYTKKMVDDESGGYIATEGDVPDIDDGAGTFNGQPFGCFQNGGGEGDYVYYHVVVER